MAVVPPISKDKTLSKPYFSAIFAANTAPPAGPDSTNLTGKFAALSMEIIPPPECIKKILQSAPASFIFPLSRSKYDFIKGLM